MGFQYELELKHMRGIFPFKEITGEEYVKLVMQKGKRRADELTFEMECEEYTNMIHIYRMPIPEEVEDWIYNLEWLKERDFLLRICHQQWLDVWTYDIEINMKMNPLELCSSQNTKRINAAIMIAAKICKEIKKDIEMVK